MDDNAKILNFPLVKGQVELCVQKPKAKRATSHPSAFEQKRDELREQILARYGQLSESDLNAIVRTQMEKAPCAQCKGFCSKEISRWSKPLVEVRDGKVFIEYALCPFGIKRYEQREFARAGIPEQFHSKTFADYKASVDNNEGKRIAREILFGDLKGGYFYGSKDTGKTFLAALIAQDFVRDFRRVRFLQEPAEDFTACDLIVLDAIDTWTPTKTAVILNQCADAKIVATAKCSLDELEERLGADNFAKRIASRLREMTQEAFFGRRNSK